MSGAEAGWAELGHRLIAAGLPEAAARAYHDWLARAPDSAAAIAGLARCDVLCNRHRTALAGFRRAAALEPDVPAHRWNAALAALALGDWAGWRDYEARWEFPGLARRLGAPRWSGAEPIAGRRLLLWAEQGFGDAIQFVRYAPMLAARGARITLEAPAALVRLFTRLAPTVEQSDAPPAHELHCPLMSLPLAVGPAPDAAYLSAAPGEVAAWRARLAGLARRRIGLVWRGAARAGDAAGMRHDRNRSLPPALLAPLLALPGIAWISLQKPADPAMMMKYDWTEELTDFAATAALIAALDLVIAVDTAVAHLAGALGRPVWLLSQWNADWRWTPEAAARPWYPAMRIFRQPRQGDWRPVVEAVRAALLDDG